MTKRKTGVLKACMVLVLALLMLLAAASVPVMADDGNLEPGSGSTPENSGDTPSGAMSITGYKIMNDNSGNSYTGQIHMYNSITVELQVYDSRIKTGETWDDLQSRLRGHLNTASFLLPAPYEEDVHFSAVKGTNIGEYIVQFQNLTYTGIGKTFACDLFYQSIEPGSLNNYPMQSLSFEINQCVEYVEPPSSLPEPSSSSEPVVKGTGFVLKEASYGQSEITAGQPFTLSATMLATNGDNRVENVSLTVTPAKELSLRDGSSVVYIGTVAPGQSVPAAFNLLAPANVEEGSYPVLIDIKGVDAKTGADVSAQVSITVPVLQPERFEIFNTQLPTDLTAGMPDGMGYGSITLVNQGKGAVSNVSVDVVGPGVRTEEGKQYVGNVAGGEQKSADFNVLADTPGQVAAQVVVSYESARGEAKELTYDFTINVMEGMMEDPGMMPMPMDPGMMEPEQTGMPVWGWLLIGLGVVLVVVVVLVIVLKRRKKKKAAALEDDYEDE